MRVKSLAVSLVAVALAGCGGIPRDPDGTIDHVRSAKIIRLGMIEGAALDEPSERALAKVAGQTGARLERISGHGEELLERLEEGELDLVYGHFADDSPWATAVYFGTPPGGPEKPPKSQRVPRFAFKLGENGWISTVEGAQK